MAGYSPSACLPNFRWSKKFTSVLAGLPTQLYGPNPNRWAIGFCTQGSSCIVSFGSDDGTLLGIRIPSSGSSDAFVWYDFPRYGPIVSESWFGRAVAGGENLFSVEVIWIPVATTMLMEQPPQ